jgi:hypothetical protein
MYASAMEASILTVPRAGGAKAYAARIDEAG